MVGVTAGASAPEVLVQEVLDALAVRYDLAIRDIASTSENVSFKLPRVLAD